MLQNNHPQRFRSNSKPKLVCSKLADNGKIITDTSALLECWANHFKSLGLSQCDNNASLPPIQGKIEELMIESLRESDAVLDCDISVE